MTDEQMVKVPRALLQAARDYIGSVPTIDAKGHDRFFDALRIVEPIEKLLAVRDGEEATAGSRDEQLAVNGQSQEPAEK